LPTARRRFHSGVCANAAGLIGKIRSLLKSYGLKEAFLCESDSIYCVRVRSAQEQKLRQKLAGL